MKKLRLLFISSIVIPFLCNCAAVKYKVIFDSNGGTSVPTQEVAKNKCAKEPDKPTKDPEVDITYTFDAWHKVVDGQMEKEPFDFINTPIVEETTLKATWTPSTRLYTVSFDTGEGGCVVEPQKVEYKGYVTKPEGEITRQSTAQYDFEFEEWQLNGSEFVFETTQITSDTIIKAKWKETVRKYTVDFDVDGGSPQPDPMTDIEYGKTVVEAGRKLPTNPTKPSDQYYDYAFGGWQMEDGQMFSFYETKILGPTHLKAKWISYKQEYTIYFNSNGGTEVAPITNLKAGEPVGEDKKPQPPTKEDFVWKYKFENWYEIKDGVVSTVPFNFRSDKVNSNITLLAKWQTDKKKTYSLTAKDGNHLAFALESSNSFTGFETTVNAHDEFTFQMSLDESSNATDYKLPTSLIIKVGNRILKGGYTIEYPNQNTSTAMVTIKKNIIDGAVEISGHAVELNSFALDIALYGASSDARTTYDCTKECIINLQEEGYGRIDFSGVWVKFDNDDKYVNPLTDPEHRIAYEDMDFAPKLRIYSNKVTSNVSVLISATEYPLLDALEWSDINEFSREGIASQMFNVGDIKAVKVNNLDHVVRIIGFNHDEFASEETDETAGITFEFANVITNNSGDIKTSWDSRVNTNFPGSVINNLLNNSILNLLPSELQSFIKEVKKPVAVGDKYEVNPYHTAKLFLLSCREMNEDDVSYTKPEGETYEYYKGDGAQAKRVKSIVAGGPCIYWLRSPYTNSDVFAYSIKENGSFDAHLVYNDDRAVAPAFCI